MHDLSKENKTSYIGYLGCSLATQTLFEINSRFYAFTRDEKNTRSHSNSRRTNKGRHREREKNIVRSPSKRKEKTYFDVFCFFLCPYAK